MYRVFVYGFILLFGSITSVFADFTQQGYKLVGSGNVGNSLQGCAVALSADGNTAIIGGFADNNWMGAAWVFVRTAGTWNQQGPKLVGTGAIGAARQGRAVALSGDGKTALIAGPQDDASRGAVWVWIRNGNTWFQQAKLVVSGSIGNEPFFGSSVSLSKDGNTAAIGAERDDPREHGSVGAVWIWKRNGSSWTQQTKLVGTGHTTDPYPPSQGASVAISSDGSTVISGGPEDDVFTGAAWVFRRNAETWRQQGPKLVGAYPDRPFPSFPEQGVSVALNGTGDTAMIGGWTDPPGATWVWVRTGTAWIQQSPKFGDPSGSSQGNSVGLSSDGNTAIVGDLNDRSGRGAARIWRRSGTSWTQIAKLVGIDARGFQVNQGFAVAISADGKTVISGGAYDQIDRSGGGVGAAWVFVEQVPTTTTVASSPNPSRAGDPVTLRATVATLSPFGPIPTATVTFRDGSSLLATVPLDNGTALLPINTFGVGTHLLSATFDGNSSFGASTSAIVSQIVKEPLIADFRWQPLVPAPGEAVQFTDRSSGEPTEWKWEFGDGASSTAREPSHSYEGVGDKTVTLIVIDGTTTHTVARTITVHCASCITLTGRVLAGGAAIRGNGTDRRTVGAFNALGQRVAHAPIGEDGTYEFTLPKGTYTLVATIEYSDYVGQEVHKRFVTRGLANISVTGNHDIAFPPPIVLLHGIQKLFIGDGPERWTSWRRQLEARFTFTPRHTMTSVIAATDEVKSELALDFDAFSGTPRFHVIAHSKGGLIARLLRTTSPYDDHMDAAVLLGTPNTGSNCFTSLLSGPVDLSWCDIQSFNADHGRFPGDVFVIAGTAGGACFGEAGPTDGAVPVDSVFKISGPAESQVLPGVVVPLQHGELGTTAPWLLTELILPYLDRSDRAGVIPPCPSTYVSHDATCSQLPVRPMSDWCLAGRGLYDDGTIKCSATPKVPYDGIGITWHTSPAVGLPPSGVETTIGQWTPCPPLNTAYVSTTEGLIGYYVLRSRTPILEVTGARIGFALPHETFFVDTDPIEGVNYYAVVAVYDEKESGPAAAEPITYPATRRRAVHH